MKRKIFIRLVLFTAVLVLVGTVDLTFAFKLPDTGQTKCYQGVSPYAEIPCTGTGQDGDYDINPLSYTDNGNGTVTDNNTSLIWQKEDDGTPRAWDAAGSYCASLGSAWRLPTKKELVSIVNYSIPSPGPTIDQIFIDTKSSSYWSSTPYAYYADVSAWYLNFGFGYASHTNMYRDNFVRCVRGVQSPVQDFSLNSDGTVTDKATGLMWQQGESGYMTWVSALSHCEELRLPDNTSGYTDWRLPNIKELLSITDDTKYYPDLAIDTYFFPNAEGNYYCSSTSIALNPTNAWTVYFGDGNNFFELNKSEGNCAVRCVRGGQSGPFGNLDVSPVSHDFGEGATYTCSAIPQVFTISNTGDATLLISSIALSDEVNFVLGGTGNVLTDCLIDNPLGNFIPPGGSCTFTVAFCPTSSGTHPAYLTILSNDPDASGYVPLSGTGIDDRPISLSFPLSGYTAYTAPVSSVFDHTGPLYQRDGTITAFDGEVAAIINGGWCYSTKKPINTKNYKSCKVAGYKKADGSVFLDGKINYNDVYLYYDGHPGYDYPAVFGTSIAAAADGILCAATYKTTYDGKNVWRNPAKCPYGHDAINGPAKKDSWNTWHALYIVHPVEDYTSWYLHSSSLDPLISMRLVQDGYADVTKASSISRFGHTGLSSGDHLHFEVRHGDATSVDPYGYGNDPALWADQ